MSRSSTGVAGPARRMSQQRRSSNSMPLPPTPQDAQFEDKELEEIRRYEDFTTIDWVQDAARERYRRRQHLRELRKLRNVSWIRRALTRVFDVGQPYIVIILVGVAVGANAAFLNVITEWLSDFKLGYCSEGWYLNQQFCCWQESLETCTRWKPWSSITLISYIFYVLFAVLFASTSAFLVRSFAPYAAGSGISEIKCIIAGFIMKGFLGFTTLVIKTITLPLAIASGLSVGKEGPSVHVAVCAGHVIARLFRLSKSAFSMREIYAASSATGVAVAFGAPIGGVLFSLEEMMSFGGNVGTGTVGRGFLMALVACMVIRGINPFWTGGLVMFEVRYERDWHFFEILFFVVIGIFGGLYGAFVIKFNLRAQAFRKKYLSAYPITEVVLLATITAITCYWNAWLRIDMTEEMERLFKQCEGVEDYNGICQSSDRWRNIFSLLFATIIRTLLIVVSYGSKVPAGIFVPSMAVGASFGRFIGLLVRALHSAYPHSAFFAACPADGGICITPGTYAFLGAGAALSGIMHITVSVVVIMFELTGGVRYILPTMIVVGVTKMVGDWFGKAGIADRMIWFNGFPFLDNKEEHSFGVPVSAVMIRDLVLLPSVGLKLDEVESILSETDFGGYPIVQDRDSKVLLGYIGRTELKYAIDRAKRLRRVSPTAMCYFTTPDQDIRTHSRTPSLTAQIPLTTPSFPPSDFPFEPVSSLDFSQYIDSTPISIHPHLPLETVMDMFKKLGPRVVLVELRGKVCGLITVKDVLKYQFKVENEEHPRVERYSDVEERIWNFIETTARRIGEFLGGFRTKRRPNSGHDSDSILIENEEVELIDR